jgi:hypothetical protein
MRTVSAGIGACLLAAAAVTAEGQVPRTTPPPAPPRPGGATFVGSVRIAGEFADPGTEVDVVIYRSGQTPISCAHGTVESTPTGPGQAPSLGYMAPLEQTPTCLNPDNTYHFYVNGVRAPQKSGITAPGTKLTYVHLTVPEVALKTSPEQTGVRLVWFYGKVRDRIGRPPPDGTTVTAESKGGSCSGTGKTQDLYWVPKTGGHTIGALGWYFIPIEMSQACADHPLEFRLWAGPKQGPGKPSSIKTPPYGVPANVDLVMPTP